MPRIGFDELLHEVSLRTGMPEDRRAHLDSVDSAIQVIVSAIAAELPTLDREALVRALPVELVELGPGLGPALGPGLGPGDDGVFERVARELHLPVGAAVELTEVVLRVIGARVDAALRTRLQKHLPRGLAVHLEERSVSQPPPRLSHPRADEPPPPRTTLSSGRLGSSRPLSEAAPHPEHQHSVAANPDPHGETRLSGARGLTQERLHDTLAEGAPPRPR